MSLIPHHLSSVAIRKRGVPGWEPYRWAVVGSDTVAVTGGIPRLLTRGPRKGQKTWDGPGQTEYVTRAEQDAEFVRYENDTGRCGECFGSGEKLKSWHHIDGATYMPCPRCNGSKEAPR